MSGATSSRRMAATDGCTLRAGPHKDAAPVAYLDKGVIGVIRRCKAGAAWCQVEVDHRAGWLRRDQFWGSFAGEAIK